jgi:carbon monoxide dehydrogenase subunit G
MPDLSKFESRTGTLTCTPGEIFEFVTDIRNIREFVPGGNIDDLLIEKDSISFHIAPLGKVNINLAEKEPHTRVVYNGNALQLNNFTLILNIKANSFGKAEVKMMFAAHLNPILKMMAVKPIDGLLEKLIEEMEKFRNWKSAQ